MLLFSVPAQAQKLDPVQWTLTSAQTKIAPGGTVAARLTAKLEPGWHLYSPTTPPGGPIPTSLKLDDNPALDKVAVYQPQPERKFDPNFNLNVEWFQNQVDFLVSATLKKDAPAGPLDLTALVRYQACDDRQCYAPKEVPLDFDVKVQRGAGGHTGRNPGQSPNVHR